jgi:hypothetical protein
MARFTTGNIESSKRLGFAVGNLAFLESQESRVGLYFRSVEFGTHGFIGRKLTGLWGLGTRLVPATGDFVPSGLGTGQQFFPLGPSTGNAVLADRTSALAYLRKADLPRRLRGIVRHEIEPMNAYKRAGEKFNVREREREAIKQAFAESGLGLASSASGVKPRGRSNVTGEVGKRFETRLEAAGFFEVHALSTRSRSLANIDRTFQAELTNANRLLAEALAGEVALLIKESLKRPLTSKGWMAAAATDRRNRFPS